LGASCWREHPQRRRFSTAQGRSLGEGAGFGQGRGGRGEGAALDRQRAEHEQRGRGVRRLLALGERIGKCERTEESRLGLGEAPEPEERATERAERARFTGDIPQARFSAQELVREVLLDSLSPARQRLLRERLHQPDDERVVEHAR